MMRRKRVRIYRALRAHRRQLGFDDLDNAGEADTDTGADGPVGPGLAAADSDLDEALLGTPHTARSSDGRLGGGGGHGRTPTMSDYARLPRRASGRRQAGAGRELLQDEAEPQGRRRGRGGGGSWRGHSPTTLVQHQRKERLCESDVPYHVHRVYLSGGNSTGSPWTMPAAVPTPLRPSGMLDDLEYTKMVRECNRLARHSTVVTAVSVLLHVLCYYPLGALYI